MGRPEPIAPPAWAAWLLPALAMRLGLLWSRPVGLAVRPVEPGGSPEPLWGSGEVCTLEAVLAAPVPGRLALRLATVDALALGALSGEGGAAPQGVAQALDLLARPWREAWSGSLESLLGRPPEWAEGGPGDPAPAQELELPVELTVGAQLAVPAVLSVPQSLGELMAERAAEAVAGAVGAHPVQFPVLEAEEATPAAPVGLEHLLDVPFTLTARLGQATRRVDELARMGPGSLIELDRLAGEPVDLLVNDVWVGRGEVVVVDDNFAVRITELGSLPERLGVEPGTEGGSSWGPR